VVPSSPVASSVVIFPPVIFLPVAAPPSVIPNAESVFKSQSMKFASSLPAHATIMVLIPNEAHESLKDERHKLITDHNPYFIPTNLVILTMDQHISAPYRTKYYVLYPRSNNV
jgi:hypothetical protein